MRYTKFASTDLQVSRLCLGTMTLGKQTDEPEALRLLDAAAAGGVNFIDTADGYPMGMPDLSRTGRTEEILGRWLRGKRDRFVIATKAGAPMSDDPSNQGGSRALLMDAIDGSLRRLDTDYVDLYQMHFDDTATPMDETLRALDDIVRSGKARYIGVSNIEAKRLAEALTLSDHVQLARYVSVQPRYNFLYRDAERELLPLAQAENLAVIPYNPLAGGMLTGRYSRDDKPSTGRFSQEIGTFGTMYQRRYWHDAVFSILESAKKAADEHGVTLPKLMIAWMLAEPAITSAIVGASKAEQLADTLDASDFDLSPELREQLNSLSVRRDELL
jgi:aryl-alcohol dehydrogenase-like predicted oxidoreductase